MVPASRLGSFTTTGFMRRRSGLWRAAAGLVVLAVTVSLLLFIALEAVSTGHAEWERSWITIGVGSGLLVSAGLALFVFARLIREIASSERRFLATFQYAPAGMALLGDDTALLEINDALCVILGRGRAELIGRKLGELVHVEDRDDLIEFLQRGGTSAGGGHKTQYRFLRPDRSVLWGKLAVSGIDQAELEPARYISLIEDVSEARQLSDELAYQASHDHLTGLRNRREFERYLDQVIRYSREHGTRHALCLVDLDQFKVVNDNIGHAAGDSLLVRAAEQMQHRLRPSDILARLGGDEFGIILVDCPLETAVQVAERIRGAIAEFRFPWEDRVITVSGSVGVVELTPDTRDAAEAMQAADLACYTAKDLGRNHVHVHTVESTASIRRMDEMTWVNRLKQALDDHGLCLHAQLIEPLDTGDGEPAGYRSELLVRMIGAEGELYAANQFIGAAERYNVARALDRWVIAEALGLIAAHRERLPEIRVWHINLSGQSLDCASMLPEIIEMVNARGIAPQDLCFEITESAAIYSLNEAQEFCRRLRELGCQVALDDFGKGLSSFGYLRKLPVDLVKIDGSFVRELGNNELDHAMVRSIGEIARIAGKGTIAESVESDRALAKLRELDIDYAQGYAIHTPCPLEELDIGEIAVT